MHVDLVYLLKCMLSSLQLSTPPLASSTQPVETIEIKFEIEFRQKILPRNIQAIR